MSEKDRRVTREEYAEIWQSIPVSESVIDIPEGATAEGATQNRVLPTTLSPEEGNRILNEEFPRDKDS